MEASGAEAGIEAIDRDLDRVEDALRRLDDGRYGTCGRCGAPLPAAALEQDPLLEHCPKPCGA